jgi:starvation-inducible DNA-binding protein
VSNADIVTGLNAAVADATVFYQKLRAFHWTVKGPNFYALHEEFETLYTRWAEIIDELAERVMQLDGTPPLTLKSVLSQATLQEAPGGPKDSEMVAHMSADLEALQAGFRKLIAQAEEHHDRSTANLLDDFLDESAKAVWMLKSFNGK